MPDVMNKVTISITCYLGKKNKIIATETTAKNDKNLVTSLATIHT